MNYKFVYVQLDNCPSVKQWGWLIDNTAALMEFITIKQKAIGEGYFEAKRAILNNYHCKDPMSNAIHNLFYIWRQTDQSDNNMITDLNKLHDTFIVPIQEIYKKHGEILVWSNLIGFAPFTDYTVLKTEHKSNLIFPQYAYTKTDIRIIQWPGGKHYYAKIGNIDVEMNGDAKWDLYDDAYRAAKEYLKIK